MEVKQIKKKKRHVKSKTSKILDIAQNRNQAKNQKRNLNEQSEEFAYQEMELGRSVSNMQERGIKKNYRRIKRHQTISEKLNVYKVSTTTDKSTNAAQVQVKKAAANTVQNKTLIERIKEVANSIKKVAEKIGHVMLRGYDFYLLITIGCSVVIPIICVIGLFSLLMPHKADLNQFRILVNDQVEQMTSIIEYYTDKYGCSELVAIVKGIIMVESQGSGLDQTGCLSKNIEISYENDGKEDEDETERSIECSVFLMNDLYEKASGNINGIDTNLLLAIQGYEFGTEYIDWAISSCGGYSIYSSMLYSNLFLNSEGNSNYAKEVYSYVE